MEYVPEVQQEFFLTNLLKASDYSVVVKAFNAAGSGPPSHELYVRTLDGGIFRYYHTNLFSSRIIYL